MNGLLLLFYCLEILAALLCRADGNTENPTTLSSTQSAASAFTPPNFTTTETSEASSPTSTETFTTVSSLSSSRSPAATPVRPLKTTTTTSTTVAPHWGVYRRECHALYLVSGGLIIVCTVLLVSSLMLTCKVRHLSRRLEALSGDADLISNSEFWMGTAGKNKSRSGPGAKETNVLMTDFSQTQEADGANKEEDRKVSVDGQTGEENKKKVEENGDESKKETPVTKKSSEETADPKSSTDSSTEV